MEQKDININDEYAIDDKEDISKYDSIKEPAMEFSFVLDDFQKRSIIRLEQGKNVLVCAHTSSGKTVVAEYGIALGRKHKKKVIYTSPIKALSNQKYRDFKKIFDDIGILTGDVNINSNAQCVIMTTEILQNCLYKNSEILSQLEWIIFDEVHYINDDERGHVWEEILILLPKEINLIMLSATIPNYMDFAKWVGNIKKVPVYVEVTLKRVIPLRHQIYIDNQNIFEVKDTEDKINEEQINKAINYLKKINTNFGNIKIRNKDADIQQMINNITYFQNLNDKFYKPKFLTSNKFGNKNDIKITKVHYKLIEIIDYLRNKDLCPAVIFVFSIRRITEYTRMLSTKRLLTDEEQNKIIKFYNEIISSKLSKEDKEIPQIKEILEILKSGIGLHHAGLLPILKEIIEILYSQGLIKVLFATTSFSIGLNMPTRTVAFTDLYKFNEGKTEILSSSEYLQMCGRAGRRGKDKIGNVYIILTEIKSKNEENEIKKMLKGEGTDVHSKLRLSYKTFLSFSSKEQNIMQTFVHSSFLESKKILSLPKKINELKQLQEKEQQLKFNCRYDREEIIKNKEMFENNKIQNILQNFEKKEEKKFDIEDYPCESFMALNDSYINCNKKFFSSNQINERLLKYHRGVLLKVKIKNKFYNKINKGEIVMLINYYNPKNSSDNKAKFWCLGIKEFIRQEKSKEDEYDDIFIGTREETKKRIEFKKENQYKGYKYFYEMYEPEDILNIYEYPFVNGIRFLDIKDERTKNGYFNHDKKFETLILKQFYNILLDYFIQKNNVPNKLDYDYSKYVINDVENKNILNERKKLKIDSKNNLCYNCPLFEEHMIKYKEYKILQGEINEIKKEISPENMAYFEEYNKRKNILKDLKYITEDNMLTIKGKSAREINTTDCVIVSEILLSDTLANLADDEVVAFLSGFATNKNKIEVQFPNISDNLTNAYEKFNKIYDNIQKEEKKNDFKENIYNRRFMPEVAVAIQKWMNGASFGEICKLTELEEGKLYNLILRIFLFFEEIHNFYTSLENIKESERFENIKNLLLRGIMGVQSLYLQDKIDFDLN